MEIGFFFWPYDVALVEAMADPKVDMASFERDKVKGAIRTDFILSAEIMTIASLIQAEGRGSDMPKVSRVIYNRLDGPGDQQGTNQAACEFSEHFFSIRGNCRGSIVCRTRTGVNSQFGLLDGMNCKTFRDLPARRACLAGTASAP